MEKELIALVKAGHRVGFQKDDLGIRLSIEASSEGRRYGLILFVGNDFEDLALIKAVRTAHHHLCTDSGGQNVQEDPENFQLAQVGNSA